MVRAQRFTRSDRGSLALMWTIFGLDIHKLHSSNSLSSAGGPEPPSNPPGFDFTHVAIHERIHSGISPSPRSKGDKEAASVMSSTLSS